jgi:hypothetical protein
MKTDKLTRKRLLEVLQYNPDTGVFIWRVSRGTKIAGSIAGNVRPDGYIYIAIDKVLYRQSRLVWLYIYGRWPREHIDHKNRSTSDDRIINLREASRSQNLGNRKRNKNNSTGFKGVSRHGSRFRSYINKDGKRINLGAFNTARVAHAKYVSMAKLLFGEFARLS